MSFESDLNAFARKIEKRQKDVFVGVSMAVKDSIVEGSAITGAPGQPIDTGNLKTSWQLTYEGLVSSITTNVEYAPHVEDNVRGVTFRNHGPHSLKLTRIGFTGLVNSVVQKVAG